MVSGPGTDDDAPFHGYIFYSKSHPFRPLFQVQMTWDISEVDHMVWQLVCGSSYPTASGSSSGGASGSGSGAGSGTGTSDQSDRNDESSLEQCMSQVTISDAHNQELAMGMMVISENEEPTVLGIKYADIEDGVIMFPRMTLPDRAKTLVIHLGLKMAPFIPLVEIRAPIKCSWK